MSNQIPPGAMFRSFLTVSSGYVLTWILAAVIEVSIGLSFFPEYTAWFNIVDEAARNKMRTEDLWQFIPVAMFIIMVVLNFVASLGVGWFVVKTAPFAYFAHAVFLAVILFVFFLTNAIEHSPAQKQMDVVYMAVIPVAVLLGAKFAANRSVNNES